MMTGGMSCIPFSAGKDTLWDLQFNVCTMGKGRFLGLFEARHMFLLFSHHTLSQWPCSAATTQTCSYQQTLGKTDHIRSLAHVGLSIVHPRSTEGSELGRPR